MIWMAKSPTAIGLSNQGRLTREPRKSLSPKSLPLSKVWPSLATPRVTCPDLLKPSGTPWWMVFVRIVACQTQNGTVALNVQWPPASGLPFRQHSIGWPTIHRIGSMRRLLRILISTSCASFSTNEASYHRPTHRVPTCRALGVSSLTGPATCHNVSKPDTQPGQL